MRIIKYFNVLLLILFCQTAALAQENTASKKSSDAEIIIKNNAYVLVPLGIIGFSQWNWGDPAFHRKDEGYFQESSRYGGADKAGHFYSSYLISGLLSKKFNSDGIEKDKAALYGSLSSLALTTIIELGDATTKKHGFSKEDEIMNTIGALASYVLTTNPNLNKKFAFKVDYIPTSNPFKSDGRLVDDYDGARYIASIKLSGFEFTRYNPLRFIELQASYRATGYIGNDPFKSRDLGIGIALNINEIIDHYSGNKNNSYVAGFFNYYQPRYTYVTYDKDLNR